MKTYINKVFTPLIFLIASVVIASDQISKYLASQYLTIACNKGIAFGIGEGSVFLSLFVLVLIWLVYRGFKKLSVFGWALIYGGGFSNIIDRIYFDCVRDFIHVGAFPSFNLADSAITIGTLMIIYRSIKK